MRIIYGTLQGLALGIALLAGKAAAQPAQDPTWPCVQRLVPKLEPGQMWSGPPLADVSQPSVALQETARRLTDLKAPPEALAAAVKEFAVAQPEAARAQSLGDLFSVSLDWLNDERDVVVRGIRRFAENQRKLADKIVAETRELESLQQAAAGPTAADVAKIDELTTMRQWDTRIFGDRQKSLTLVCDQPVALEQRAFALARLIQEQLP